MPSLQPTFLYLLTFIDALSARLPPDQGTPPTLHTDYQTAARTSFVSGGALHQIMVRHIQGWWCYISPVGGSLWFFASPFSAQTCPKAKDNKWTTEMRGEFGHYNTSHIWLPQITLSPTRYPSQSRLWLREGLTQSPSPLLLKAETFIIINLENTPGVAFCTSPVTHPAPPARVAPPDQPPCNHSSHPEQSSVWSIDFPPVTSYGGGPSVSHTQGCSWHRTLWAWEMCHVPI